MNGKPCEWLKKQITPLRQSSAPSPTVRKIAKSAQVFFVSVVCFLFLWRAWLYIEVHRQFVAIAESQLSHIRHRTEHLACTGEQPREWSLAADAGF